MSARKTISKQVVAIHDKLARGWSGGSEAEFISEWINRIEYQRNEHRMAMISERKANPDKIREINRASYANHRATRQSDARKRRVVVAASPELRAAANQKRTEYIKARKSKDPQFRLRCLLRTRVSEAMRSNYGKKSKMAMALLGCTIQEARSHIEKQWKPGMSWENHSPKGWHIDHVKPFSRFDLTNPDHQKEVFHYTNLQPLWWHENLSKGDNVQCS